MSGSERRPCAMCGRVRAIKPSRGIKVCSACRDSVHKMPPGEWAQRGACRDRQFDPEWWWPTSRDGDWGNRMALAICRTLCPVRDACLAHAIDQAEDAGIWGGMSTEQRRQMARFSTAVDSVGKLPVAR